MKTRIDLIRELPKGLTGAEIGVQRGDFSAQMLEAGVAVLFLVDAWAPLDCDNKLDPAVLDAGGQESNYRFVRERFAGDDRVSIVRDASAVAARGFEPASLDFLFLDAGHTYSHVMVDLVMWSSRVTPEGCIFCHDYCDNEDSRRMGFDVKRAVDNFCRRAGWKIVEVTDEEWPTAKLIRA